MIYSKSERILMVSIYIDNFLIILKKLNTIQLIKDNLSKKYNITSLSKIKVIISC